MRIFLTGAQGTGKTTISNGIMATELGQVLTQFDSQTSAFIASKKEFADINKHIAFQAHFVPHMINAFINKSDIISSRFISDLYSYAKADYAKTGERIFKTTMDFCLDIAPQFNDNKVRIVYVPIMIDLQKNKYRSGDVDFQKTIDDGIQEFLELTKLPHLTLDVLDIGERVKAVENYARKWWIDEN